MSYWVQAKLAADSAIMQRVTACAASEGESDPAYWAQQRAWKLSAQPGWVAAYKSALDGGDTKPGQNEAAITDGMILAAVQALNAAEGE